jgi:hypothetical protein
MYTITFSNTAGELDRSTAETPEQAAAAVVKMIEAAGVLYSGDTINIRGEENDE